MRKKIKIIRITTVPISLKKLLKGQLRFMNNFYEVIGVASPGEELADVEREEGIRTIPLYMSRVLSPIGDIASLARMVRMLLRERPDIVHSHTPKAGIVAMLASFICNVPHRLHTVAGLPLMEATGLKRQVLLFVEWLTYKCATKVYPNSNGLKKYIIENISVARCKLSVIGYGSSNGIDTKHFDRTEEVNRVARGLRKTLNLEGSFSFIFLGRIVKDKGIEELLAAFDKLSNESENVKLIIVGWEENDLDPMSGSARTVLESNSSIINVGFKDDVRPYLAISNCLTLPSYREGFPNVVLQACSMRLPCIVSDINGCNEIIQNTINGLVIKPKDAESLYLAMKKLVTDQPLLESLSQQSRKGVVDKYSQDFIHNEMLSEYERILNIDE